MAGPSLKCWRVTALQVLCSQHRLVRVEGPVYSHLFCPFHLMEGDEAGRRGQGYTCITQTGSGAMGTLPISLPLAPSSPRVLGFSFL